MQCKLRSLFSPKKIASHRFNCICTAILAMPDNLGLNFLCFSRMDPNWYIFTEHYLNMYILLTIIVLKCIYISKLVPFTTLFSDCIKCWHFGLSFYSNVIKANLCVFYNLGSFFGQLLCCFSWKLRLVWKAFFVCILLQIFF